MTRVANLAGGREPALDMTYGVQYAVFSPPASQHGTQPVVALSALTSASANRPLNRESWPRRTIPGLRPYGSFV